MKTLLMVLIILSSTVAACGRQPKVAPEFKAAMDHYLALAPNSGHIDQLESVEWGAPPAGADGICNQKPTIIKGEYVRTVTIRDGLEQGAWLNAVVSHELAHCLHDKPHDTRSTALMHPTIMPGNEYWETHLDEELGFLW